MFIYMSTAINTSIKTLNICSICPTSKRMYEALLWWILFIEKPELKISPQFYTLNFHLRSIA